jgi:hypothetical protein
MLAPIKPDAEATKTLDARASRGLELPLGLFFAGIVYGFAGFGYAPAGVVGSISRLNDSA